MEKLRAKLEFKQLGTLLVNPETSEFRFQVDHRNVGMTDMKDFTIVSAQASEEASFSEPRVIKGYGFSFFGTKGYTFSPVFQRDHMIVEFSGRFVHQIPEEKFTVVLKKVKGEDSVPLFQTLTFIIEHVHNFHDEQGEHINDIENETMDPCTGEALEDNSESGTSYMSLFDSFSDYLSGMYPVDMNDNMSDPE